MKRLYQAVALLLALAAVWMLLIHLQPAGGVEAARLTASSVRECTAQSMDVSMPSGAVDINTADEAELETLFGVGPSIAGLIVEERELGGPFHYPEDLLSVKGIGEKTLNKFRDQIRIH